MHFIHPAETHHDQSKYIMNPKLEAHYCQPIIPGKLFMNNMPKSGMDHFFDIPSYKSLLLASMLTIFPAFMLLLFPGHYIYRALVFQPLHRPRADGSPGYFLCHGSHGQSSTACIWLMHIFKVSPISWLSNGYPMAIHNIMK